MSKFFVSFKQMALYQKIGYVISFILAVAVILLGVLHFTRIFGDMNNIMLLLLALELLDNAIITWEKNKIFAITYLVVAVIIMAEGIFFLVI